MSTVTVVLFLSIILSVAVTQTQNAIQYFVASNGSDSHHCTNHTNPCGTLYQISVLIQTQQSLNETYKITVINGQNENEIIKHQTLNDTNHYNPCFPKPFNSSKKIEISLINIGNIFLSNRVCNNKKYLNEYMFDGGYAMTLNNIKLTNVNTSYYSIMRSHHSIVCNDCEFININIGSNKPLFYTNSSVYLRNNKWENIHTNTDIIYASNLIKSDNVYSITNSTFTDIYSDQSLLNANNPSNYYDAILTIQDCIFQNISTQNAIIYDRNYHSNVSISN
eukprot:256290_1